MSQPNPFESEGEIIDVGSRRPRRRRWLWLLVIAIAVLVLLASRGLSIYLSALWFGSLGYAPVYWYMFRLKITLFVVFTVLTVVILRAGFWLLERTFRSYALERRTIMVNNQPVSISPARFLRPAGWVVAILFGLLFGLDMRGNWRRFALYAHQAHTSITDPIFNKPVGFYLFTLPIHQLISWWLLLMAFVLLCGAIVDAVIANIQQPAATIRNRAARNTSIAAVSFPLASYLLLLAWR